LFVRFQSVVSATFIHISAEPAEILQYNSTYLKRFAAENASCTDKKENQIFLIHNEVEQLQSLI
jgi:hypothetical protein